MSDERQNIGGCFVGGGGGGAGGNAKIIGNGGTAIGGAGGGGGGGGGAYTAATMRYTPTRQQRLDAAANAALAGMLASHDSRGTITEFAGSAYDYAEAMLAESDRRSQTPAP